MATKPRYTEIFHDPQPVVRTRGQHGEAVSAIIDDLVTFAIADATGRSATARAALASARRRFDELQGRVR